MPAILDAERQSQIVQLLAIGVMRFHRLVRATGGNEHREQPQNSLDVVDEIRLHVLTGSVGERPERTGERQEP